MADIKTEKEVLKSNNIKRTIPLIVWILGPIIILSLIALAVVSVNIVLPHMDFADKRLNPEIVNSPVVTVVPTNSVANPSTTPASDMPRYKLDKVSFNGGYECKTMILNPKMLENEVYWKDLSVQESGTIGADSDIFLVEHTTDGCIAHYLFNFSQALAELNLDAYRGITARANLRMILLNRGDLKIYFAERNGDSGQNFDLFAYNLRTNELSYLKDLNAAIFGDYIFDTFIYNFDLISVLNTNENENMVMFEIQHCQCGACEYGLGDDATATERAEYNSCLEAAKRDSAKIDANLGVWSYNTNTGEVKKLFAIVNN